MRLIGMIKVALEIAIPIVGVVAILDIPLYLTNTSLFNQQYLALFWGLASTLIFITTPALKRSADKGPRWYDLLAALLSLALGLYVTIYYPRILSRLGIPSLMQMVAGGLAVVLVLESLRRIAGWAIVIIILFFLVYAKFGHFAPGILCIGEIMWSRLLSQLYLGADFMLGIPLRVAVLIVFGFILFGQVLFKTGGGEFFIELAQSLMGRYRGGPAKVAVLASSIFGTLSGSSVANVAGTGVITIPMMKKTGYPSAYAGAIEATASSGGILMPPVMGAAAFIMAEFLEISYQTVVVAAIVPALLYYFGIYMQIDLHAASNNLKGLPREQIPSFLSTIRKGWIFLIPLVVMVLVLFILYLPPSVSALYSTGAVVVVTLLGKNTRTAWSWSKIISILQGTSRAMLTMTAICAAAGLVVGIVGMTGLGLSFSRILTEMAGGSLFLLAVLTALASIILGMGMPTTAAYILLAVLAAPAMVKMGIEPILAHLFVFYFGELSMLTPPVCLAAYAASSICGAPALSVAFRAMRLAVAAYIVPFVFIVHPGIALIGTGGIIFSNIFLTLAAIAAFAFAFEGYCIKKLRLYERLLFICAAITLAWGSWGIRIIGLLIVTLLLLDQLRKRYTESKEN